MSVHPGGVGTMIMRKVVAVVVVVGMLVGSTRNDFRHHVPDALGRAVVVDLRRRIAVVVADGCPEEDRSDGDRRRREEDTFRATVTGEHHMARVLVGEPR